MSNQIFEKIGKIGGDLITFYLIMIFFILFVLDLSQQESFKNIDQERIIGTGNVNQEFFEKESSLKKTEFCIDDECEIPSQLFDIEFGLREVLIENSNKLETIVIFESFGTLPTPVDLTFIILNESGNEIYEEKIRIIVETENIIGWNYGGLSKLSSGKYVAVLQTLYNTDVFDEFKQEFEISGKLPILIEKHTFLFIFFLGVIIFYIINFVIKIWKNETKKIQNK